MRATPAILAVLVLISISCGDKGKPASSLPVEPTTTTPVSVPTPEPGPPLPAGFPDSVAGRQLAWVIDAIVARHGMVDATEVEAHFHPSFLAQVPTAQTIEVFKQLGAQADDLTVTSVEADPAGTSLVAKVTAKGEKFKILLVLDPGATQIAGLLFQPDIELGAKPTSIAEAVKTLPTIAPHAQLLLARLDNGACKPLHQVNAKEQLAIGSTMKLYILLAVADQIIAGKLTWDTEIPIRDDWKSLPSGITQGDPAGTKHTVRTLAERMISISDNTATDHLLYTVGRKKVEAAVKASRHVKPALDIPFLSTRELFLLKLGLPDDQVERYIKMSAEKRRAFLDKTLAGQQPTLDGIDAWKDARRIETLEWFANSEDLCRLMAALALRAEKPAAAPVLEVMAKNPGIQIDPKSWPYIGFKGGSEPGVMNLTWLLRRDDHRWYVATFGFNAPAGQLVESKLLGFTTGVLELLGTLDR
jgi:beta-lactamase class A